MSSDARVRTVRLDWTLESVPSIRRTIVDDLSDGEISDEVIGECEIVVSELVTNAIRHAKPLPDGSIRVHWKVRPPRIEIEEELRLAAKKSLDRMLEMASGTVGKVDLGTR